MRRIRDSGANVLLCTPSVIGEKSDGSNRFDPMLDTYAEVSRAIAAEYGVQLLDLRQAFIRYLAAHNPEQAEQGVLTSDGVHLNQRGNRFLADLIFDVLLGG